MGSPPREAPARVHQLELQVDGATVASVRDAAGGRRDAGDAEAPARRHQLELQVDGETVDPRDRGRYRTTLVLAATVVGNALEWYDFALFGFLAPELSVLFFPAEADDASALLETFAVFGCAFLARPVGGLALGAFSDRYGRRAALQLSVAAMSAATAAIGLLPTYAAAGASATVLLVACRLAQGLSVAGQLTGALVFLVESAPRGHEHLFGSVAFASGNAGTMLGGLAVSLAKGRFDRRALLAGGWRWPFLFSAVLGLAGYHLQAQADESPEFAPPETAAPSKAAAPAAAAGDRAATGDAAVVAAARASGPKLAAVGALCCLPGAAFYALFIFAPAYYGATATPPLPRATEVATRCLALSCLALPLAGSVVDVRARTRGPADALACVGHAALFLLGAAPACVAALASGSALVAQCGLGVATVALAA